MKECLIEIGHTALLVLLLIAVVLYLPFKWIGDLIEWYRARNYDPKPWNSLTEEELVQIMYDTKVPDHIRFIAEVSLDMRKKRNAEIEAQLKIFELEDRLK